MTVQGGPLRAGQSIDVPQDGTLTLANDLTNAGTITMETAGPNPSYLNLNGHTLTNAGPSTSVRAMCTPTSTTTGHSPMRARWRSTVRSTTTRRRRTRGALTVGSTGVVDPGTFTQTSPGVTTFAHDATGATGSFGGGTHAGWLRRDFGSEPPDRHHPHRGLGATITGQYACAHFPAQVYNVDYPANQVQLVATTVMATPATFSSGNATTFTAGSPGSFTVSASGTPSPGFAVTGTLPAGVTLTDDGNGTATLGGTPAAGSGGVYAVTITASDGAVPSATQSFTLTVDEPTAITSANTTTFIAGSPDTFTATANGYPTPSLSESGTLPGGVTFTDNGNGTATLAGSPSASTGGTFPITIKANGSAGQDSQSFTLKMDRPPTAGVSVTPDATTVGAPVNVVVTASDADGDPLSYTVQFGDGTSPVTGSYSGSSVSIPHTYTSTGPFNVAVQVSDPSGASAQATTTVEVDQGQPLVANGDPRSRRANDPDGVVLDGSGSTPACCIVSYDWQVTGPSSFSENIPQKVTDPIAFTTPGTYTASLTVQTGSNSNSASTTITVLSPASTGPTVQVLDASNNSAPVQGAEVLVLSTAGQQYEATTDASGSAPMSGLPNGSYSAYVVKSGFDPNQGTLTVSGGAGTTTISLAEGGVATASLTSSRITDYQTLLADGIDPNDPNNYNIYEFDIHLVFEGIPVTFSGEVSQGGGFVGSGTGFGGGGGGAAVAAAAAVVAAAASPAPDPPTRPLVFRVRVRTRW